MISTKAIRQLAQHHGEPVIVTLRGKGDCASVLRAIESALNGRDLLCLPGPGEQELAVFDLTVDLAPPEHERVA